MAIRLGLRGSRFVLGGGVFGAGLEEGFEDGLGVVEVVVHDVDEEASVHQLRDHLAGGRVVIVELGPLLPELERLILWDVRILWL